MYFLVSNLPVTCKNGLSLATRRAAQPGSIAAYIGPLYPLKCCITSKLKLSTAEDPFTLENVTNSKWTMCASLTEVEVSFSEILSNKQLTDPVSGFWMAWRISDGCSNWYTVATFQGSLFGKSLVRSSVKTRNSLPDPSDRQASDDEGKNNVAFKHSFAFSVEGILNTVSTHEISFSWYCGNKNKCCYFFIALTRIIIISDQSSSKETGPKRQKSNLY